MKANVFVKILLYVSVLFSVSSCGENLFSDMSGDTDESLRFEAQMLSDDLLWTQAISKLELTSAAYLAKRENQNFLAHLYAGRCGLDFLGMIESLTSGSAASLFGMLMDAQSGATADKYADCIQAETIMMAITAVATERTDDENLAIAFIEFAKIGSILNFRADTNNDGTTEFVNNSSCAENDSPALGFSDTEAKHLFTGLAIALDALANVTLNVGSSTTDMSAVCTLVTGGCDTKIAADVDDATEERFIRSVVQETSGGIGLGVCAGDAAACLCP